MEPKVVNNVPVTPEHPPVEAPVVPVAQTVPPQTPVVPGSKTDPALLLKSLQEEREKNRLLEEALATRATTPSVSEDVFSDEGKAIIEKYVKPLQDHIVALTENSALKDLFAQYPVLKEVQADFASYRQGFPGIALENVAKAFLAEKGLLNTAPERKGLENPSGGAKPTSPSGMTADEVANLRINNYPKYIEMVKTGQLDIKAIK